MSVFDKLWSRIVRDRDGHCVVCGRTEYLAAHHLIGRTAKSVRLDPENGYTLCPLHHTFSNDFSAHRTPRDFKEWAREKDPKRVERVENRAKVHKTEREAIKEFQETYGEH